MNLETENQGKKAQSVIGGSESFKNRNVLETKLQNTTSGFNNENNNLRLGGMPEPKKLAAQTGGGGLYSTYFDNIASQINPQRAPMTVEEMLKMKRNENKKI